MLLFQNKLESIIALFQFWKISYAVRIIEGASSVINNYNNSTRNGLGGFHFKPIFIFYTLTTAKNLHLMVAILMFRVLFFNIQYDFYNNITNIYTRFQELRKNNKIVIIQNVTSRF